MEHHDHGLVSKLTKYIKPKKGTFLYKLAKNDKVFSAIQLLNSVEGVSHAYTTISSLTVLVFNFRNLSWWAILLIIFAMSLDIFFGSVSFFTSYCMEVAKMENREMHNEGKSE